MPSVSSSISSGVQALNGSLKTVVPSQGIPSKSGGSPSGMSTWTTIKIYEKGKPRFGRGMTRGGGGGTSTWVLPLPMDLNESNSLSWEQNEFGAIEQTLAGGPMAGEDAATNAIGALGSAAAGALKAFDADIVESLGSALTRTAANPATEVLFKAPNLRTFQFSWNLIPLTKDDSSKIIEFRKEMIKYIYPKAGGLGGATRLFYPAEFEVSFNALGKSEPIFSTFPAACTEFTVNYGVQGMYGIHEDGNPTQVTINATFQEIYMLVRNDWE